MLYCRWLSCSAFASRGWWNGCSIPAIRRRIFRDGAGLHRYGSQTCRLHGKEKRNNPLIISCLSQDSVNCIRYIIKSVIAASYLREPRSV